MWNVKYEACDQQWCMAIIIVSCSRMVWNCSLNCTWVFKVEVVPDDVWETFSTSNFLASKLHINKMRVVSLVWATKATFGWSMILQLWGTGNYWWLLWMIWNAIPCWIVMTLQFNKWTAFNIAIMSHIICMIQENSRTEDYSWHHYILLTISVWIIGLSPLVAVLLCDEGVSEVDKHPRHTHNAVYTNEGLWHQQCNAYPLRTNCAIYKHFTFSILCYVQLRMKDQVSHTYNSHGRWEICATYQWHQHQDTDQGRHAAWTLGCQPQAWGTGTEQWMWLQQYELVQLLT